MIIDKEEDRLEEMLAYSEEAKIGDCTNIEVLKSLGVGNYDAVFVCIGTDFQSSLEATSLLKELGAKYVVSKATRDIQAKFLLRNGADEVIYPDRDIAMKTAIRYSSNHIFDFIEFTDNYSIYEISAPKAWVGKSIKELDIRNKLGINIQKSYTLRTAELVCRGTEQINAKFLNIYICMSIGLNRISVKYHRVFLGNLTYSFDILYSSYFIIGKHNTYKYGIGSYAFFKFFQRYKTLIINIKIGDFISQALKVGAGIKHGRMLYFGSYYMLALCFISRGGQFNSPIIGLGASGGKINLTAVCRKGICYNFS